MANEKNLIDTAHRTKSEVREIGRKGGIASGKARLRKKHGRELLRILLSMPETDERLLEEMEALGIVSKDATSEVVMHARQIQKAKRKADTVAYNAIMKAAGYIDEDTAIDINIGDGAPVIVFGDTSVPEGQDQQTGFTESHT